MKFPNLVPSGTKISASSQTSNSTSSSNSSSGVPQRPTPGSRQESPRPYDKCPPEAGMRLCFVGYGSIAQAHARAFQRMPGVEFAWVVGRDPASTQEFAQQWGFAHQTLHLEEALAADVDAVVITSPSDLHAAQA